MFIFFKKGSYLINRSFIAYGNTTEKKTRTTKPSTKTTTNKFKEFGQYIVKTVFPSEDEFKTSKANIEGIQQQLYIQILTLANGSIGSVKQLQQVKLRIYDLPIYPDENGTLKKLGREKISSADSNVSAKSDDRIQAPNTLQQVFSTLNLAVKKSTVNKTKEGKLKETFWSGSNNIAEKIHRLIPMILKMMIQALKLE